MVIIKSKIQIYDKNTNVFNRNGRVLNNTLLCYITEELNGTYELELDHPLDARLKWQELKEDNIIKADGQYFRIYHKKKVLNRIVVNARHIFYDLYDNFLEDVRPENLSGIAALDWILARTQFPHPFICTGDVAGSNTRYFVRQNVVEAIMGSEGIINTWGGEIERDNFIIRYKQARGLDRGVHVRYGKNIIGIEETINLDSVCTRMMPIGRDGLMLPEKYIDSPYINNYPHPKIRKYEFDIGIDEEKGITEAMAIEQLRAAAIAFRDVNKIDIPPVNYKIDFIELSKTEEYKNYAVLETVYMGDTVTIKHSKLNIDLKAKVIRIKKNVLTDRIEVVELGNFKNNLASALSNISNGLNNLKALQAQDKSSLQQAIDNATTLLTTALGGYVLKRENEILIMDTKDPMTATKVWRWNLNGLGYSDTGINGPYETAITMDGSIVGSFLTVHSVTADHLESGIGQSLDLSSNTSVRIAVGQIGGNNLIKDSSFEFGKFAALPINSAVCGREATTASHGSIRYKITTSAASPASGMGVLITGLVVGKTYTFSADVRQPTARDFRLGVFNNAWGTVATKTCHSSAPLIWERFSMTFVATETTQRVSVINSVASVVDIYTDCWKLEEGENATAWSPHADELKSVNVDITDDGLTVRNGKVSIKNNTGTEVLKGDTSGNLEMIGKLTAGGAYKIELDNGILRFIGESGRQINMGYYDFPTKMITHNSINSTGAIVDGSVDWKGGSYLYGKIYNQVVSCYCAASSVATMFAFTVTISQNASVGITNILGMYANSLASEADAQLVAPVFDASGELISYQIRLRTFGATPAITIKVTTTIIGGR